MTKSEELAEKFKSGSVFPIIDEMIKEFPLKGIQQNKIINELQFRSYLFGILAAKASKIAFPNPKMHIDREMHLFQENRKKPFQFKKSLMNPVFVRIADENFSKVEKEMYAELLLTEEKECDQIKFYAAFFRELGVE